MPLVRRLAPALVVSLALASSAGAQPDSLATQLAGALAVPHVALTRSGAAVVDLSSGRPVYEHNASLPLAPASNEKLVVAFAVLSELGPSFRIETDVLGEGEQRGAVWRGDLVLKGYGDPTLSSADLRAAARQVRAAGIARITGAVVADESWFDTRRTAPGWKASFYLEESPPLSALVVDHGSYRGSVSRRPALAAALLFRSALRDAGVAVAGPATVGVAHPDAVQLGAVRSPPLETIVREMDLESDNFDAEMLLKGLGADELGKGSTPAGAAVARRALSEAGIPLAGVRIVDGSGLSVLDRLTANALVALLQAIWSDSTIRPALVRSLPVAGVSGTLKHRMQASPARGRVHAKTGTTSLASALSGFANRRYAFAVVQNGHPVSYWWARLAEDRFATLLAGARADH